MPESLPGSFGLQRQTLARRPICESVSCYLDDSVILFPTHVAMVCRSRPASVLQCLQGFTFNKRLQIKGFTGYSGFRAFKQAAQLVSESGRCSPFRSLHSVAVLRRSLIHLPSSARTVLVSCDLLHRLQGHIATTAFSRHHSGHVLLRAPGVVPLDTTLHIDNTKTGRSRPATFSTADVDIVDMVGGLSAPSVEAEEEAVASTSQGVIFVLENAKLETAKVGKVSTWLPVMRLCLFCLKLSLMHFCFFQGYQLLNCDDHKSFLTRHGKDPAEYRPDICHQVEAYDNNC